jgi:hypothetical protein
MNGQAPGPVAFLAPFDSRARAGRKWWEIRAALAGEAKGLVEEANGQGLLSQLTAPLKGKFRYISASRGNAQQPAIGQRAERLTNDGGNIVGLLDSLQRKGRKVDRFVDLVSEVLPAIQHISVRTLQTNTGEVALWEHGAETERDDLASSLTNSGTGVRHILIMLLLAFCEPEPVILLIDELEHSLHPGAIRELLHIFNTTFPDNQFVIGTHSPTAIASGIPATVSVVKKTAGQSSIQLVDRSELRRRQELLAEIGASISDLFGADAVLWVEGATEEICFQRVLDRLGTAETPGAVVIKGLIQTGDLGTRDAERVLRIYDKLSGADALFPPAVGFILDDDGRSDQQKTDLRRHSRNRMRFLNRRMFENYLLHPEAIAAVLSSIEGAPRTSSDAVRDWLDNHCKDPKYGSHGGPRSRLAPYCARRKAPQGPLCANVAANSDLPQA